MQFSSVPSSNHHFWMFATRGKGHQRTPFSPERGEKGGYSHKSTLPHGDMLVVPRKA